ncbi:hypothetical protein RHGRI_034000 [Rhododendron griersonianum]|uniref:Uncharacterized protein n=1 Tax=Rhododendron griersonianum TaxID=479676 RepID=A0AAV6I3C5_9ERIC|nr:hypothetical protein RHGRI_034000 [Rhododendron griersonianum]
MRSAAAAQIPTSFGLSQSWIQAEVGLLGGFVLVCEDLPLVVTRLQSQRHSQRIFRIFVKMSASNMFHQNVFDGMNGLFDGMNG